MRSQTNGLKRQFTSITVRSNETSVTIKRGAPMAFDHDGAAPGLTVKSIESLAAAETGFFAGLALAEIAPGKIGDGHIFGIYEDARVVLGTRAASTDVWASYSAGAIGDIMGLYTVADVQAVIRSGAGSNTALPWAYQLAETYASSTTQASSLGGTSLASVVNLRCMIRAM